MLRAMRRAWWKHKATLDSQHLPDNWLEEIRKDFKFTPDVNQLERKSEQFLFIWDDCQRDHKQHEDFMNSSCTIEFVGQGFTVLDKFVMYKKEMGLDLVPVVIAKTFNLPKLHSTINHKEALPGRIKGELYLVKGYPDIILELDRMLENGYAFKRVRINVAVPYSEINVKTKVEQEKLEIKRAWMYIGLRNYWNDLLDCGFTTSLVRRYKQEINRQPFARHLMGDYYSYTLLETKQ